MNIYCFKNAVEPPTPNISFDGKSYTLKFPLPSNNLEWLKIYLENDHIVVRAQFQSNETGEQPEANQYECTVPLPPDVERQAFFPTFRDGNLSLSLQKNVNLNKAS